MAAGWEQSTGHSCRCWWCGLGSRDVVAMLAGLRAAYLNATPYLCSGRCSSSSSSRGVHRYLCLRACMGQGIK